MPPRRVAFHSSPSRRFLVPHLTIAQGQDDAVLEEVEAGLRGRLPVTARVSSVDLMGHDGTRWQQ
ncbi:2'-5' RNA ligase family protein [Streptomyces sp. NBC_01176]|uniref:2'-5' RNA ligase family protein n=1 Tax=Streptomyces sp. NBC_01176 TaxID=2903760 RepID=UPI0038644C8C